MYNYINVEHLNSAEYYQVPFKILENEICIYCENIEFNLCFRNGGYYDFITDDEIKKCLNLDLEHINIEKGWEGQTDGFFAFQNVDIHTLRITKLVKEILNNKPIKPISMFFDDRSFQYSIPNYIEDGNHRIRALKYLKYDYFPAFIHGNSAKYLIDFLNKNKF